jgi:hypothetical protein
MTRIIKRDVVSLDPAIDSVHTLGLVNRQARAGTLLVRLRAGAE